MKSLLLTAFLVASIGAFYGCDRNRGENQVPEREESMSPDRDMSTRDEMDAQQRAEELDREDVIERQNMPSNPSGSDSDLDYTAPRDSDVEIEE